MSDKTCTCGAKGDVGELTEHIVAKLGLGEDSDDHRIVGEPDPVPVVDERERAERRQAVLDKLAEVTQFTPEEIREALRV